MKILKTSFEILASLYITLQLGCGALIPKESTKESSVVSAEKMQSSTTAALKRVIEGAPPQPLPNLTVGGGSNTVSLSYGTPLIRSSGQISPGIVYGGEGYREQIDFSSGLKTDSSSQQDIFTKLSSSIPFGVKLILLGMGMVVVAGGIWAFRWTSLSAKVAIEKGDRLVADAFEAGEKALRDRAKACAERANAAKSEAAASTDPAVIARAREKELTYTAELSVIEAERGKLAAKKKRV